MKYSRFFYWIGLCCLLSIGLSAQQTSTFTEPLRDYKLAQDYFRLGNYPLAQQNFASYLEPKNKEQKLDPYRAMDASFHMAKCAAILKKSDAVHLLTKFVEEYGNNRLYNSLANYELAQIFYKKRNYRAVLATFDEIYENDLDVNEYEEYKFMQAYSHFNLEQFDEAYPLFETVARVRGKHLIDASYYVGYLAFEKGDYGKAVQSFLQIEKDNRYRKIIPYYITQIYYKQNDAEKLIAYTVPKLKQKGLKYKTQMNKIVGQTYYDRQQFREALPYLSYYVENSNKVSKEDLYLLAYTQYQFGEYEKAIENFLQLNTLSDNFGQNAMYHLADCYIKIGEKANARTAFADAASLDADADIKRISAFNHAKLSYELGFNSEAITALRNFIEVYPNVSETDEAKALLGQLFEVTQNYTEAIEIIESIPKKTKSLKKSYQRITYAKAVEFYNGNRLNEALVHFDKSLQYPEESQLAALTHFWKGNIFYDQKKLGDSTKELQKYLKKPGRATAKVSKGVANYTIGYNYFTQKRYGDAQKYFDKAISSFEKDRSQQNASVAQMYPDAALRSGDCLFISRSYDKAKKRYNVIIKNKMDGADYATYQVGMIAGLQQDMDGKIATLRTISQKYPDSYYSDDALFQIATTQGLQLKYNEAIITYQSLKNQYPESKYVRQAMVNMGLLYYNLEEYDASIVNYEKVIAEYPNSSEAQEAVVNLKEAYIAKGDSDSFFEYVEDADIEISTSGRDTTMYQFAESYYLKGACKEAILEFNKYLTEHPRGAYTLFAHFYRGDCLYQQRRYKKAANDFDFVLKQKNNLFTEKSLVRGAKIAYSVMKDDDKAFAYYKKLLGMASQPETTVEALRGLVKSSYNLGDMASVEKYGEKLLANRRATSADKIETNFFLAKIAYKKGTLGDAQKTFESVASQSNNEIGAEARYLIAEILYKSNKLEKAKEACFRIDRETPAQEYWVVKSFILLGDIYAKNGELYQAKQTLKSLLDNYDGDAGLVRDAQQKYNKIVAEEKAKSKLEEEGDKKEGLELEEEDN